MRFTLAFLALIGGGFFLAFGDEKKPVPNQNSLIAEYKADLEFSASSFWGGWPASLAFDRDPKTSWFSGSGDAAAHKKTPWLQVTFPGDVTVRRVTALGNREALWPTGYSIGVGKLELYDKDGKLLLAKENECGENHLDIDFPLPKKVEGVRSVRFVSVKDEGDQNPYDDIALGELQVE
jgi:hypothetical protein